ncbi:MAG: bifunctional UDP-N-acetylglucosamine diphosphorylase/glucosamine-1-phosphate N-acetyltransferase GlmU, partial [Bryobacteraceae bacterium]
LEPRRVRFVRQTEQKGTGHALMVGRDDLAPLSGLLVILYGDCPLISPETLRALLDTHRQSGAAGTVITTLLDDPTGYGRVLRDASGAVAAIVEQKAGTPEQLAVREINTGIYCFQADLFWRYIDRIRTDNPACEYYLTDIAGILTAAGHRIEPMRIADAGEVLGINNRVELAQVDRLCRQRAVHRLMLNGVTIEKPETVTIDEGVRIGQDTIIGPFAQILGRSVIGSGCSIGACSIIQDSELADRVEVGAFTIIGTSRVESDAHIGPYARLRMGNHVGPNAHIGNFVELKKTSMGAGSKAMHLAYLGDSEIGARVNIGAGTITCNYDGVAKHATGIRDGAFVGSNSTLVAPVVIGEGAYIAAGSVITHAVPPGALAIGRSRQSNKEGWKKRQ